MDRKITLILEKLNLKEHSGVSSENSVRTKHAGSTKVPPKERVFAINFLLDKILRCLSVKDLKTVRLTCSNFNNVVLDIFGEPGFLPLQGNFYRDEPTTPEVCYFNVQQELTTLEWQLPDLIAVIKSSTRFPIQDFRFRRGCVQDPWLQEFFSLYGSRIRRLYLHVDFTTRWHEAPHACKTFEVLFAILRSIPNIEHLKLDYIPVTENGKEGNIPENIHNEDYESNGSKENDGISTYSKLLLPRLQILKLGYRLPDWFFLTLVISAPKLKELRIKNGGRESYFTSENKLHLLKKLHVGDAGHVADQLKLLKKYKIMSTHPSVSLSTLQLYTPGISPFIPSFDAGRIISDLFHYNRNSLKSVKLCHLGNLSHYCTFQIPQLPNVLKLEIVKDWLYLADNKLLPPVMDMSKTFPNLKYLIINIGVVRNEAPPPAPEFLSIRDFFAQCPSPMPTVEYLCFMCDPKERGTAEMYSSDFMEFFSKLCPRVTFAEFRSIGGLTHESGDIWKFFGKLTHLKLFFHVFQFPRHCWTPWYFGKSEHTLHSIDSFFTGISVDNLKLLSTWNGDGNWNAEQLQKIQEMRTHPSILLLKDLKRLEIIVYNKECFPDTGSFVPTLTDASKYFGFNFCHKLHVSLSFNLQIRKDLPRTFLPTDKQ